MRTSISFYLYESEPLRRLARLVLACTVGAALLGVLLAGAPAPTEAASAGAAPGGASEGAPGPFPVTIEHKFGVTVIPEEPKRIVSIGYHDHESLLALGVVPVALRYNYGDHPYGVFPWAQHLLGDAKPAVLDMTFGELDFEAIASFRPDLISAVYSGITREEYERLSRIAPTLAQSGEYIDFGMPWQEQTLVIGTAVGRKEAAEAAVASVEARYEEIRRNHPEWAGKKVILAVWRTDGQIGLLAPQDARTRVFTNMGFEVPGVFEPLFGDLFYAYISTEQLRMLDEADVIVWHQMAWSIGRRAIEQNPLFRTLRATREGRHLFLEGDIDDALQFGTVVSLPHLLEELVPMLEQILPAGGQRGSR